MTQDRAEIVRDIVAIVVAAVACPLAFFGGALLGCAAQGFDVTCARSAALVAPPLLILAGLAAAALTRGTWGYVWVFVGVLIGMVLIWILAFAGGNDPLPVGPIEGSIATLWFLTPVTVGYVVGRGIAWAVGAWRRRDARGRSTG
jgi:hypothetical protein